MEAHEIRFGAVSARDRLMLFALLLASAPAVLPLDRLSRIPVPPSGEVLLKVERSLVEDSVDRVDSCRIERAEGAGRQHCIEFRPSNGSRWETLHEGYANGLELPDRITVRSLDNDSHPAYGYILRREALPSGNRWITDSIPGFRVPWLRNELDSLILLNDSLGRVVERRQYLRGHVTIHHTVWGPWGPVFEVDSAGPVGQPARQALWDSAHWIDGRIAYWITWVRWDSLDATRDSTPGDGRQVEVPPAFFEHRKGDTVFVDHGDNGGTRYAYLDSLPGRPPLLLEIAISDCVQGACRDESRRETTYAILHEAASARGKPTREELLVQRRGRSLRWAGPIADGATVLLSTTDGNQVGRGAFQEGRVSIDLPPTTAPLVWSVRHQGRILGSGSVPVR